MDEATSVACEQLSPETWATVASLASLPLCEDALLAGGPGSLYTECGGIESIREAVEHFGHAAARRPAIARLLPHRELQWLRVRLVQLLVHAAGAPLRYSGPRLHALYQQHGIPALLADQVDEMLVDAMCAAQITRFVAQSIVRTAKFRHANGH